MDFLITTVISTTSLLGAAVEVDAGLTDSHSQCPWYHDNTVSS